MTDNDSSLDARLEALEQAVSELQAQIRSLQSALEPADQVRQPDKQAEPSVRAVTSSSPGVTGAAKTGPEKAGPKKRLKRAMPSFPDLNVTPEELLKWSGIGLVLIAVGLLFKYAIDVGWLTPSIRIAIGFVIGLVLMGLGFRIHRSRPRFGQALQGGGIAAFYITLFAAFQVLEIIPYPAAFVGMVSVTGVALTLGLWQEDAGLAVFGLIGGLTTPFLLYTGEGDIAALISYSCLLLAATTTIYMWKGW